ncbi:vWA domain-containing protein [Sunxiuqinia elliptica]|uniref:Ca-activated chloride channel family protein n=1 Tax=Sunxiuqinia elliptica TaxID=655355 RepID=A0A4R6GX81_9BACT|nr:VWA domain-containing protein [Sunxiuqinia elliptica]TDO00067.1 Ca-activated chloride channel family protein [Sunxiuqinia elliptica]TDO57258.1 Ca-activated chloride channel family protein [Sunxiuqinia elliptica]
MEMFRFAHIEYLYALGVIPVFIILFWITRRRRRKALERFGQTEVISQLMPNVSKSRPVVKFIIWLFALASLIIATARPQFGSKLKTVKREGVELVIALDVSNSMMAEDIQPNRLERAKRAISRLVDNLNDDKIGLIVFAGDAYTQLPITTDYPSAKLFLNAVNTDIVPRQGTAIGAAIELASVSFSPQFEGNKAIVIITDGENHEDDAIGAATSAAQNGIIVHTIGMGLPQGGPIPVVRNGQRDYRKDKEGNVVVTKLNEEMLQQIAAAGNGIYVRANNAQVGLNTLFNEIDKMEKSEMESLVYSDYEDQFQWFIAFAIFLILLDFLILERKNKYLKNIKLFG